MEIIDEFGQYTLRFDSFNTSGKDVKVIIKNGLIIIKNVKSVAVGWVVPQLKRTRSEYLVLINPHEDNLKVSHLEIGVGTPSKYKTTVLPVQEYSEYRFIPEPQIGRPFDGWNKLVIGHNLEIQVVDQLNRCYGNNNREDLSLEVGDHAKCLMIGSFKNLDIHLQPHSSLVCIGDTRMNPNHNHSSLPVCIEALGCNIKAEENSCLSGLKVVKSLEIAYYKLGSHLNIFLPESLTKYKCVAKEKSLKSGGLYFTHYPDTLLTVEEKKLLEAENRKEKESQNNSAEMNEEEEEEQNNKKQHIYSPKMGDVMFNFFSGVNETKRRQQYKQSEEEEEEEENLLKEMKFDPPPSSTTTKTCTFCLSEKRSTVIVPCGHNILCVKCAHDYSIRKMERKCPICNKQIEKIIKLIN